MKVTGKHEFQEIPEVNNGDKLTGIKITTVDPDQNDDGTSGYYPGYIWKNTTNGKVFEMTADDTGAAAWYCTQDAIVDLQSQITAIAPNLDTILLSGGVTWSGTDYDYDVTACSYKIQGITYNSAATSVSLSTPDLTNDRIDVIYADTSGNIGVIQGTPAAQPSKPALTDPFTQIEVSFITVASGTTTPPGAAFEDVYLENAEWTGSISDDSVIVGGLSVDFASTISPATGSLNVNISSFAKDDEVIFTRASAYGLPSAGNLIFKIKLNSPLSANSSISVLSKKFSIILKNGGSTVSTTSPWIGNNIVKYGINPFYTSAWQTAIIPLADFGAGVPGQNIDKVVFRSSGGELGAISMRLDDIKIENSTVSGPPATVVDAADVTYNPSTPGDWSVVPVNVKAALDTLAADLAAGSGINNVVEDTTPELGGDLDLGSYNIYTLGIYSINLNSNNDVIARLGDAGGAQSFKVNDINDATVFSVTSDGIAKITETASARRKIVLYETADNDYQFAGFGTEVNKFVASLSQDAAAFSWEVGLTSTTAKQMMELQSITGGTNQSVLKVFGQATSDLKTAITSTATTVIDWNDGNAREITLAANITTLTLNNPVAGATYVLKFKQNGTGNFTVAFPTSILFPDGTDPVVTAAANSVDMVVLFYDGTNYIGTFSQNHS